MRHTPGPWRMVGSGRPIGVKGEWYQYELKEGDQSKHFGDIRWRGETHRANARLVEAAPELRQFVEDAPCGCWRKENPEDTSGIYVGPCRRCVLLDRIDVPGVSRR